MIIYTGFNTKIMQKNFNEKNLKNSSWASRKSVAVKFMDSISYAFFIASIIVMLANIFFIYFQERTMLSGAMINFSSVPMHIFKQLLLQLSFGFEMIPFGIYMIYDQVTFWSAFRIENLFMKSMLKLRLKYNILMSYISIRCRKHRRRGALNYPDTPSRRKSNYTGVRKENGSSPLRKDRMRVNSKKLTSGIAIVSPISDSAPLVEKKSFQMAVKQVSGTDSSSSAPLSREKTVVNSTFVSNGDGKDDEIKIINISVLPDIGSLDHIVFDKTDTLTTSKLEVMKLSTTARCYAIDCTRIAEKLIEIKAPGNNLLLNDSQDEIINEKEEYSEKSQE